MWKQLICILNSGGHQVKPTTKRQGQRSTGTLQLRPPAVFVLHRQGRHLHQELHHLHVVFCSCVVQRSPASGTPCGRDISPWSGGKSHNRNPLGSNEVHQTVTEKPQRPRAIVLLARPPAPWPWEAAAPPPRGRSMPVIVQQGPASVRSPACGRSAAARMHNHIECASGHLPLESSVPSCWSRCLLQGLFHIRCMLDLDW